MGSSRMAAELVAPSSLRSRLTGPTDIGPHCNSRLINRVRAPWRRNRAGAERGDGYIASLTGEALLPRLATHIGKLSGDEAVDRRSDAIEGGYSRAQLLRMDWRFAQAMARAPEAPRGDGRDRVAEGLLPARRP